MRPAGRMNPRESVGNKREIEVSKGEGQAR
jgi:hypothetical protein